VFGWIKQASGLRQLKARGRSNLGALFRLNVVAYNLIRITNLLRHRRRWHEGIDQAPKASKTRVKAGQATVENTL
jgi:hypothetical protein